MEAGATILAGQSLEFNPTGSVVIPFANTGNTIIGYALQGATTGNSFLMVIKTKNY
jgi:hypothetical protein